MTFLEKFEAIKKKFAKADLTKLNDSFAIQVNLTDEDCCGAFYIAYINDEFAVEPYDYHDHTAMITADSKSFEAFISGKKDISVIGCDGNEEHIKTLVSVLEKKKAATKKAAAKKTTEKKPAEKKTAAKKTATKKTAVKAEQVTLEDVKVSSSEVKAEEKAPAKKRSCKKTAKKEDK